MRIIMVENIPVGHATCNDQCCNDHCAGCDDCGGCGNCTCDTESEGCDE